MAKKTMKVPFIKNAKYRREYYKSGAEADVLVDDVPELIKAKVIPEDTEIEEVDDELEDLRAEAKALGIRGYHSMGKEKLIQSISEKKAELANDVQLKALREQAVTLQIEVTEGTDVETLKAAIDAALSKRAGGGDGN